MGDLESQPMSEIMDQDDDQSNSFFDLTNIPSNVDEEYEYDNYDEEKEKKIRDLEALVLQQRTSFNKEIEALNSKLAQREKENMALLHQLELSNLKIEALRDFNEEKGERIDILEEMKTILLTKNQRLKTKYKPRRSALKEKQFTFNDTENIPQLSKSLDITEALVSSLSSKYQIPDVKGLTAMLEIYVGNLTKNFETEKEKQDYKALKQKYEKLQQDNQNIEQKMKGVEQALTKKYYDLYNKVCGLSKSAGLVPNATLSEHVSGTHSRTSSDFKNSDGTKVVKPPFLRTIL